MDVEVDMTISLHLDKEEEKKLKQRAEMKKVSVTEVVKEALRRQLEKEEKDE